MSEKHDTRGGDGKFIRDAATAERDAEAARLRARGLSFRAIAREMGWESPGAAHLSVQRALRAIVAEPAEDLRTLELERLDEMQLAVLAVLERKHVTVSGGRVIYHGEEPLLDDAPVLAAVDRLLKIQERRAKLCGLDSPVKADIGGTLRYEIAGVDLAALK